MDVKHCASCNHVERFHHWFIAAESRCNARLKRNTPVWCSCKGFVDVMNIRTDADKILETVQRENKISLQDLSRKIGLDEEKVESICSILVDKELIDIVLPVWGGVFVGKRG